jgi:hypothetical protein
MIPGDSPSCYDSAMRVLPMAGECESNGLGDAQAWQMVKIARCFLIATQSRNRTTSSGMRMIGFSDLSSRDQLCHASVLFEGHPIEEAKRGRGYADRTYPQLLFVGQGLASINRIFAASRMSFWSCLSYASRS